MPASPNHRRGPRRGLTSLLLVLGLTWAPACTKQQPASAPLTDLAHGSDYVAAPGEPAAATETVAEAAFPSPSAVPRIRAADVGGEHDDLVTGDRMRAEYEPGDPWLGALQPKVTLVAFVDYQCPYSKRLVPTLYELAELYADEVDLAALHDEREDRLQRVAEQRLARGEGVVEAPAAAVEHELREHVVDLMQVLRQRIEEDDARPPAA